MNSDFKLVGIRALDDATLFVELENPTAYFLNVLPPPIPQHVVETCGDRWAEPGNIVTNGPFCLESWQPNELVSLVANPRYHGRFRGNLSRVEITQVDDYQTKLDLYEANQADIIFFKGLESRVLDHARQMFAGEFVSAPTLGGSYLVFDTSRPPFDDWRVRRAFALSIDKQKLAGVSLRGFHAPATGGLLSPGIPGHFPDIGLAYRPDHARRLLAQAGFPGGRHFPQVELISIPIFKAVVDHLIANWHENLALNIDWELMVLEKYHRNLTKTKPNMIVLGFIAAFPDPSEIPFNHIFEIQAGGMVHDSRQKKLLHLIQDGRYESQTDKRLKYYRQADKILVEDALVVPLTYAKRQILIKPSVKHYPISIVFNDLWKDVIVGPRK